MTLKTWVYTMNLRLQNMRLGRGLSMDCWKCKIEIVIGDEVYSRNASSAKSKSKLYHKKCAELVNIL